ncbi:uncharacterized protein RCO7_04819 [Rhynchosporium graminicola]|uniref:Uncharacterized protein n=1 Tax=Rhynchosporium graminicola TaxID=2792576 RepID=A0A1E1KF09_9HELO|nr:uncharacterized protein RCO7_04819 [Rhynchosporium commune]
MAQEAKPSWWPELDASNNQCKHYKHLYTGCGCIHEGFQSLTVHSKECVHTKQGKLTEEEYQDIHRALPCKKSDNIHVILDGPCELCKSGVPLFFVRRRNSAQRLGFKIKSILNTEERSPPRQKVSAAAKKPEVHRTEEEIERRIQLWQDAVATYNELLDRRVDNRRQRRKEAYKAAIELERIEEIKNGVVEADRFHLFNFTGGAGGDLLQASDDATVNICTYCDKETRAFNPPPEKLPCGCHVHRDCAADLFCLQANGLSRQRARCTCGKPKGSFELRRLHMEFEDDSYPRA